MILSYNRDYSGYAGYGIIFQFPFIDISSSVRYTLIMTMFILIYSIYF